MANQWELTPEAFAQLLAWLDTDCEQAGKKYEYIRQRLIRIFIWRGCVEAEDMADETINRVVRKLPEVAGTYVGDPALYFYGVAKNVVRECRKHEANQVPLPVLSQSDATESAEVVEASEHRHECMETCLQELSDDNRELITRYYARDRQAKVDSRRELSRQLGVSLSALRVRAHRIRRFLFQCIQNCLALKTLETP